MTLEDLLDHFKLEAEVFPSYTIHPSYKFDRVRGVRQTSKVKWERAGKIGEGVLSQVWRELNWQSDGSQHVRAVKSIEKGRMQLFQVDFKRELLALAKFSKEEYRQAEVLVSFCGWFETADYVFLAMEYFENGDLAKHIPTISTESEVRQITANLLAGLHIIHKEGFAHRDLKPQASSGRTMVGKIGDFGISKRVKNENTALRTQIGTPLFQAPEVQGFVMENNETSEYSTAVDLWSLGCVLYNISAQRVPFCNSYEINMFCCHRLKLPKEPLSTRIGAAGISFVERLLVPEPAQRMDVERAMDDPWVMNVSLLNQYRSEVVDLEHSLAAESDTDVNLTASINDQCQSRPETTPSETIPYAYRPVRMPYATVAKAASTTMPKQTLDIPIQSNPSDESEIQSELSIMHQSYQRFPLPQRARFARSSPTLLRFKESSSNKFSSTRDVRRENENRTSAAVTASLTSEVENRSHWQKSLKLVGHSDSIDTVTFSPDGSLVASGSRDTSVRLWSVATGQICHILSGHSSWIETVAFSPDSKLIVSNSNDGTVRLWEVAKGQICHTRTNDSIRACTITFSTDGKLIALGSGDGTIQLWDVVTGKIYHTLKGHSGYIRKIAFSPDGKLVASGSEDDTVRLWNIVSGKNHHRLKGHLDRVYCVAFSPNSKLVASGSLDRTVRIWRAGTGRMRYTLRGHLRCVNKVSFSPDGKLVASCSDDHTIRLWNAMTGQICHTLTGHQDYIHSLAFSRDNQLTISGSRDRPVRVWDVTTGKVCYTLIDRLNGVGTVAISPNGKLVALGCADGIIRIRSARSH